MPHLPARLPRALLAPLGLLLAGCGQAVLAPLAHPWDRVVVDDPGDALVLDARTAAEYSAGHVPGAAQVH